MKTLVLLMVVACLTMAQPADASNPFDLALSQPEDFVFRGQSPVQHPQTVASGPLTVPPPQGSTTFYPPTFADPNAGIVGGGTVVQPYSDPTTGMPAPITQDPWLGGSMSASPVAPSYGYGVFGPQPRRFGWQTRADVGWIADSDTTNPAIGDLEVLEVDIESEYVTPGAAGWVYSMSPQFNYRSLQGPQLGAPIRDLPESLYRFGMDLSVEMASFSGCTFEFGFTPAIATDFQQSLRSDAVQLDGRAVAYWTVSPQWMWVLGAVYWDRVNDIVLPYAGAVWTPSDRLELRMLFPKSRASLFLGTPNGVPTWVYVDAEYHVESYQIGIDPVLGDDESKVQFSDWRVLGGFRWEAGWITTFLEGGYVFDREVKYGRPMSGASFDIDGQFIGRLGFRY